MDGQHELNRLGADRFVEQVIDRRLPFQLLPLVHATNLGGIHVSKAVTRSSAPKRHLSEACSNVSRLLRKAPYLVGCLGDALGSLAKNTFRGC